MSFDNSRFTFDPWKDYSGVVMEQGRVQLDADWNEWLAESQRRVQAGTLDMLGHAAVPATTPFAFQITATVVGGTNSVSIGVGRMYVDGLLAENHGLRANAVWDPALAEMSGAPQPPPSASVNPIDYAAQPYFSGQPIPAGDGPFLAYLDVWTRPVTWLEDPGLIDQAVGVDTTARLQTVWQVRLMPMPAGVTWTCATPDAQIDYPPTSSGLLTTGTVVNPTAGPCCLSSDTGYTGIENQFYRVEIHQPGAGASPADLSGATFKWSRDNASVETGVTAFANATNSVGTASTMLSVLSLGRDSVLGFAPGNWIEVLNDALEFSGLPGELALIDTIDFAARTITLTAPLTAAAFPVGAPDAASHTRIRRWDQADKIYAADGTTVWYDLGAAGANGSIPVPDAGTTLILENGITVNFALAPATGTGPSTFNTGDFWTFAARTADGLLDPVLTRAAPRGLHHHYAKLSIVTFPGSATDCRPTSGTPATGSVADCGCCDCTVGDGVVSVGKFTSIQAAINSLPATGGEVCILAGRYFEHVLIENRVDIVLRGCGWATRIASPGLLPPPAPAVAGFAPDATHGAATGAAPAGPGTSGTSSPTTPLVAAPTASGLSAVITVSASRHILLESFAVEAADGEVGILLDRPAPNQIDPTTGAVLQHPAGDSPYDFESDIDVTIRELTLTASTLPAILGINVALLRITGNRVAMEDVPSHWPAVQVSGREIHIERNWVGLQAPGLASWWIADSVTTDLAADLAAAGTSTGAGISAGTSGGTTAASGASLAGSPSVSPLLHAPGGIQIAGPATDVFVLENEIEGGARNGITLGSVVYLDPNGGETGGPVGVTVGTLDPCCGNGTLQFPDNPGDGTTTGGVLGAGGRLLNIEIARNRIRNMGLCGIGPVGFFDLEKTLEVISIVNLTIAENTIARTLLYPFAANHSTGSAIGYGAITLPDTENLIIEDNNITDFGADPAREASGIFILHAEQAVISRNQVRETRDWNLGASDAEKTTNGLRAGILVLLVTPPVLPSASWAGTTSSTADGVFAASGTSIAAGTDASLSGAPASALQPLYQPGLPALRIEHNLVRVAVGPALEALGYGPFSIVNNHFATGGTLSLSGTTLGATVEILNLGRSIETVATTGGLAGLYHADDSSGPAFASDADSSSSSGTILFANNICQLEARANHERALSSVFIGSLDHLLFADNQCWVDGHERSASADALLIASTLQVNSNRFEESRGSVLVSGLTFGRMNITSLNMSTYCLLAAASDPTRLVDANNITMVQPDVCALLAAQL